MPIKSYFKFTLMFVATAVRALEIHFSIHHGLINRGSFILGQTC
jgi:hypothetical protein